MYIHTCTSCKLQQRIAQDQCHTADIKLDCYLTITIQETVISLSDAKVMASLITQCSKELTGTSMMQHTCLHTARLHFIMIVPFIPNGRMESRKLLIIQKEF